MSKKLFSMFLAVVLSMSLILCTGVASAQSATERPTVRVYIKWSEAQLPNWPALIDAYNADATNPVTIEANYFGSEGYDDKVKAELTSDDPPEIVQLMKTTFN
ncbi:MAG TPA: hypothetical protein PLP25_04830, partial [Candidatus Limiplasma sp.]|nr:hypothetical protein [Candidatus Limiplasma sp.]